MGRPVFSLRDALPRWPGPLVRALDSASGLTEMERVYRARPADRDGTGFLGWGLAAFDMSLDADDAGLERVPECGPVIVVSNHPFGFIEGLALGGLFGRRRNDVRVLANELLARMPELRDVVIPVDPFVSSRSRSRNAGPLREAARWLDGGGLLITFPAGEVAHLRLRTGRVEDPPWSPSVGWLVRRSGATVVPVFFAGRNRLPFHLAGVLHPLLRTMMLPRELLARRGSTLTLHIGQPIPRGQLPETGGDEALTGYLRARTEILAARSLSAGEPMQPRVTPATLEPIVAPRSARALRAEIEALPAGQQLTESGPQTVFIADPEQIPEAIQEIGRLREVTFRDAGEGTGRELDLDRFDWRYRHLFSWDRERDEIIGAYRLGLTDRLVADEGVEGLYTSTLFDFDRRLFESMGPAIELGRSFIRTEHQKSYAGLLLLWRGIGAYLVENPRYATLFGPVSISAGYRSLSQRLIVGFLRQCGFEHEWSRWVRPRRPFRSGRRGGERLDLTHVRTLEQVAAFIAEVERDGKGVPILLRQYMRFGGRVLGFNIDPDFADVLDALVFADLRRASPSVLRRYMGRKGLERFLAYHRETDQRAG